MKKLLIFLLVCFWGFQNLFAQTYLQGENVISLSEAANSNLLPQSKRLSTDESFKKLASIVPDPLEKGAKDMIGEFWLIDDMLVAIITRRITTKNPKDNLIEKKKSYAPEIIYRKGTTPDRSAVNDYFSQIKSVNNFEVLINYQKTSSQYKRFLVQDNKGQFKVRGIIYVKKQDAPKAHTLINTILNSLKFK